jgi:hypothetical protein
MANSNLLALYGIEADPNSGWSQGIDGSNTQGIGSQTPSDNTWRPNTPTYQAVATPNNTPYETGDRTYGPNSNGIVSPPSTGAPEYRGHYW